jgi:hypothetical protein
MMYLTFFVAELPGNGQAKMSAESDGKLTAFFGSERQVREIHPNVINNNVRNAFHLQREPHHEK